MCAGCSPGMSLCRDKLPAPQVAAGVREVFMSKRCKKASAGGFGSLQSSAQDLPGVRRSCSWPILPATSRGGRGCSSGAGLLAKKVPDMILPAEEDRLWNPALRLWPPGAGNAGLLPDWPCGACGVDDPLSGDSGQYLRTGQRVLAGQPEAAMRVRG